MGSKHSVKKVEISDKKLIPDSEKETKETDINIENESNNCSTTNNKNKIIEKSPNYINNQPINIIQKEEEKQDVEYFTDIIPEFSFGFYDDTFDPNFLSRIMKKRYLVFFDSKDLREILDNKLKTIARDYPKHYEDLEQPLEEYMKTRQNKVYKENRNIFQSIALRFRFITGNESFNEDIRRKAKRLAFLLSQIKADLQENEDKKVIISLVDPDNYKVLPYTDKILDEIKEKIDSINIKMNNIEEINKSLNLLENQLKLLDNRIENEIENENNKKYTKEIKEIIKSFLAYEIHIKLKEIERACNFKGTEAYKKFISLKSNVNKIIFLNLYSDSSLDQKPFLENILKGKNEYTIIKETKKEKKILLSGMNVEKFIFALKNHFEELQIDLSKLDDDETDNISTNSEEDINFIQKKKSLIKNLEEKNDKNKKDINEINQKMFGHGINIIKNTVENFDGDEKENIKKNKSEDEENKENKENKENNKKEELQINKGKKEIIKKTIKTAEIIGDNIFEINSNYIDKKSLEKKEAVYNYLADENKKLMNLYLLIKKFEKKAKKNKLLNNFTKINGLMISKNIIIEDNELANNYGVDFIY